MKKQIPANSIELMNIKLQNIQRWQGELNRVITEAKKEVGIPESEMGQWNISRDGKFFEKVEGAKKDIPRAKGKRPKPEGKPPEPTPPPPKKQ